MNSHIQEFLKYYIELKNSPEYAILVDGEWGCGKTYFVKDFLQNNQWIYWDETKIIYISLFGLTSTEHIDEQIYQQLHPVLSSKPFKLGASIIKSAAKLGLKVDLDGNGTDDGTLNINLNEFIPDSNQESAESKKQLIFIFDDFERTNIDLSKILGYVNTLVEQHKFKTILIAHEKEISSEKYNTFKEKTIGKTFKVIRNFNSSFRHFLEEVEDSKEILSSNQSLIEQIFEKAGFNNLRHLRQSILDFDLFYKKTEQIYRENTALMKELIELFFIISIEIKKDNSKINTIFNRFNENSILKEKYELNHYNYILPLNVLEKNFKGEKLKQEELTYHFSTSKYYINETQDEWIKLWNYVELDDDKFKKVLETVLEKINNKTYNDIYIIVHIFAILLSLSKTGLYQETIADILKKAKETIQNNVDSFENINFEIDIYGGQYGKVFFGEGTEEFAQLITITKKEIEKSKHQYFVQKSEKIIESLQSNNVNNAIDILENNHHIQYEAIFQNINAIDFFQSLENISNKDLLEINRALRNRYKHMQDVFKEEESFWEEYKDIIILETKEVEKTITTHLLISFVNQIDDILKKIEQIKKREEAIRKSEQ